MKLSLSLLSMDTSGEQALDGRREPLSRVWSLPDNVVSLEASLRVRRILDVEAPVSSPAFESEATFAIRIGDVCDGMIKP